MLKKNMSTKATRYFFPSQDATCPITSSSTSAVGDRTATRALSPQERSQPSDHSNNSMAIRLAMRISRAKWLVLLRRVFHYQNSAFRSELGSNPFDSQAWMALELIALLLQIIATTTTVAVSDKERPVWPMRMWIIGYDIGCFLSLLLLFGRYRYRDLVTNFSHLDLENQQQIRGFEESRTTQLMSKCRASLDLFFAIWFVMGNVWVFDSRFGSFSRAPKLHVLCITILAWNAITYSFPFLLFLLLCCCVPLLSAILGYNINAGSAEKGASDHQISQLPTWNYKPINDQINPDHEEEEPECCICLAKYKDKEELRKLPCSHMFHLKCVDQWLRILSCCPLCKQELQR